MLDLASTRIPPILRFAEVLRPATSSIENRTIVQIAQAIALRYYLSQFRFRLSRQTVKDSMAISET